MKQLLITIDGPAGAGKTTVSRMLADTLGYVYVDTGALYRGVAYAALQDGIATDDDDGLENLCRSIALEFRRDSRGLRLYLDGSDISDRIRTPEITMCASAVSARPVVRRHLLDIQRQLGARGGAVFEGRDMGTVVFPGADVKFFLTAALSARARRRYRELPPGTGQTLADVERDMRQRDHNDAGRALAPMKPAEDAITIDSSDLTIEAVVDRMRQEILS